MNTPPTPTDAQQLLRAALEAYRASDPHGERWESTADVVCELGTLWLEAEGADVSGYRQAVARGLEWLEFVLEDGPITITGDHGTSQGGS
jgi:hypothetical protein